VGTSTFSYHYSNPLAAGGQLDSNTVTVTVTISQYTAPVANPFTLMLEAANADIALDMTQSGNPAGYTYEVQNPSVGSGTLKINGSNFNATSNRTGTALAYRPGGTFIGTYTFQYRALSPDGAVSGTSFPLATLKVVPSVQDRTVSAAKSTRTSTVVTEIKISDTTVPNSFGTSGVEKLTIVSSTCGSALSAVTTSGGSVNYTSPQTATTCSFTYTVSSKTDATIVSRTATVNVKVA